MAEQMKTTLAEWLSNYPNNGFPPPESTASIGEGYIGLDRNDQVEVEAAPGPTRKELLRIDQLAQRQYELAKDIVRLETDLDDARKKLARISEIDLPEAMDAAHTRDITLSNGVKVTVVTSYHPKQLTSEEGLAYLDKAGAGSLIKHDVSMQFGRGQEKLVAQVLKRIARWKSASGFRLTDKRAVNAQTLGAWVRERVNAGESPPFDTLGVFVRRHAEVSGRKSV